VRHGGVRGRARRSTGRALVAVGSFSQHDRGGTTTLHFSGRLRGRALLPGSYVLSASASLDGQRGSPVSTDFTIR
jgi:hypothetical protein